jgi:hypothetical protein
MSRLFVALYLDEDVDVLVGEMLRAYGFDVLTTLEADRLGATDEEQIAFSTGEGRALLTHNRQDFEALALDYFDAGRIHAGILLAVRRPPHELVRRLLVVLDQATAEEMTGQLRYL